MNDENTGKTRQLLISFEVKVAFWVPIYLKALGFLCLVCGVHPDYDKVYQVVSKGIKVVRVKQRKSRCVLIA